MIAVSPGTPEETTSDFPPHDLDAEGVVLSYALERGPIAGLHPKHFYSEANRRIYEAVQALAERSEPFDVVAVARELRASQRLRQVGGSPYLGMLVDRIPATANVESHAEAIREAYRCRMLSDAMLKLRVELRNGTTRAGEAWLRCKAICDEMTTENE